MDEIPITVGRSTGVEEMVVVTEQRLLELKTENLPSPEEFQTWVAAVVVDAAKSILTGGLKYKSAAEAARVAKDFVSIARDLQWADEADAIANARTPDEKRAALEHFRTKAAQSVLALGKANEPGS